MVDYRLIVEEAINKGKKNTNLDKALKDAEYQEIIYTGENQDSVLFTYRTKEDTEQKKQRKRISISRTKHVCSQIENMINWLQMMDTPMVKVISESKNEKQVDELVKYIYDNNLTEFAFNKVKHYGAMLDANAYLKCSLNKYGEINFQVLSVKDIYDIYQVNDITEAIIFKFERKEKDSTYTDYELYTKTGYYIYRETSSYTDDGERWGKYIVEYYKTNSMFVYPLGFINDSTNKALTTKKTIIESASQLFKDLIWKGSDLDVSVATQGINKQFAYAPKCMYQIRAYDSDNDVYNIQNCIQGYIYENNSPTGNVCPSCKGSGLQIHTSDQDIIIFPLPEPGEENKLSLADLIHTVYINESAFNYNEKTVERLESKIMSTVFNNSQINKSEIQVQETATKSIIDLQGVYAMLNVIGKHVSNVFIWMVECIAEIKGFKGISVIHGYTLTLKLETIEDLAAKRKQLTEANAPLEIIRAIDLAMMQKKHIDDPNSIERYSIWEQYKPFPDKSETSILSLLASLPDTNKYKMMYLYWGNIKRNIEMSTGDKFYTMTHEERNKLIDMELDKIMKETKVDQETGNPIKSSDFV